MYALVWRKTGTNIVEYNILGWRQYDFLGQKSPNCGQTMVGSSIWQNPPSASRAYHSTALLLLFSMTISLRRTGQSRLPGNSAAKPAGMRGNISNCPEHSYALIGENRSSNGPELYALLRTGRGFSLHGGLQFVYQCPEWKKSLYVIRRFQYETEIFLKIIQLSFRL